MGLDSRRGLYLCLCVMLVGGGLLSPAAAHEAGSEEPYVVDAPWEADDVKTIPEWIAQREPAPVGVIATLMIKAIQGYQHRNNRQSVSRCPFAISCSEYAVRAIRRHGPLLGLLLFIDRHHYRENPATPYMYPLTEMRNQTLKLDDKFFLEGHQWPTPVSGAARE